MFRKSRKMIAFLLILSLLMIPLVSCGQEKPKAPGPTDVLSNFLTDFKTQKFDQLGKYFETNDSMDDFDDEFEDDELSQMLLDEITNIEMNNPEETMVDEQHATVKATFTTSDIGGIMEDFMTEVFALAFDESTENMSDEEMEQMVMDKFTDMLKERPRIDMEGTVNMIKIEDEWKIADDNDEFLNVITGGLLEGMEDLVDNIDEMEDMDTEE